VWLSLGSPWAALGKVCRAGLVLSVVPLTWAVVLVAIQKRVAA
jgi:hypothetical protein